MLDNDDFHAVDSTTGIASGRIRRRSGYTGIEYDMESDVDSHLHMKHIDNIMRQWNNVAQSYHRASMVLFCRNGRLVALVLPVAVCLAACQPSPNEVALRLGAPPEAALNLRAFETRHYDQIDSTSILQASLATLQDLGFNVTESAADVGVVAAAKQRSAVEVGQVALAVALRMLAGVQTPIDRSQDIHVTVVCSPDETATQQDVRVSFDRYITSDMGLRSVLVKDQKIYQNFFDKLAASLKIEKQRA